LAGIGTRLDAANVGLSGHLIEKNAWQEEALPQRY
jgi:hypothetical protein